MARAHDWFSDAEVAALFAAVHSPWWKAFLSLGVDVGLRTVETLNLLWDDIDPLTQSIRIAGRGAREHHTPDGATVPILAYWPSQTGDRTVPASRYAIDALRRLRKGSTHDSPYAFVSADRLCRLFPLLDSNRSATTADLAPGLGRVFASVQRHARLELAKHLKQPLIHTPWPPRTLTALRNTFAQRATDAMRPADLAAHLGFAHSTAVLAHYDRSRRNRGTVG